MQDHHQFSTGESLSSWLAAMFIFIASRGMGAFSSLHDNLPEVLQWLALVVALLTIARHIAALLMRKP